jgi:hypothetical protein
VLAPPNVTAVGVGAGGGAVGGGAAGAQAPAPIKATKLSKSQYTLVFLIGVIHTAKLPTRHHKAMKMFANRRAALGGPNPQSLIPISREEIIPPGRIVAKSRLSAVCPLARNPLEWLAYL